MTKEEFAARITACEKKLYVAAFSVTKNAEDAKDAVAEAVSYAWEKLKDLKDEGCFDAWILKITYTEAKRIKKKTRGFEDISEFSDAFPYYQDRSDYEFMDVLSNAGLDIKTNEILNLRFLYGYTLEDTAKIMKLPLSSVKTKYYRALKKLSEKLGNI